MVIPIREWTDTLAVTAWAGTTTGRYNQLATNPRAVQTYVTQDEIRRLEQRVVVNHAPQQNCVMGSLYDLRQRVNLRRGAHQREIENVKESVVHELVARYMEQQRMAEYPEINQTEVEVGSPPLPSQQNTMANDAIQDAIDRLTATSAVEVKAAPEFKLRQNIQQVKIRELQNNYPATIQIRDYQVPACQALHGYVYDVRRAIKALRNLIAVRHALLTAEPKNLKHIRKLLARTINESQFRDIEDSLGEGHTVKRLSAYPVVLEKLETYRCERRDFALQKELYAKPQAEYNQHVARIRQLPNRTISINVQEVLDTISTWDNVWGVAAYHNEYDSKLQLRVGLCDIVMHESATETRYDYEAKIALAPLYITIMLSNDGYFNCPSNQAGGASKEYAVGSLSHDFHPHQLSDEPCFGTFGQSFIDMAAKGEVIPLISGLIAFYSQYNSQDSVGVSAATLHPYNMARILNKDDYKNGLLDAVEGYSEHIILHKEKLNAAMERYEEYYEKEKQIDPPKALDDRLCYCCESAPVNDYEEYAVDAGTNRICMQCWDDRYCHTCERHVEDCSC